MAVTVTPLLTTLTTCDATTSWSAGALDTTSFIQGTGCLAGQVSNTTSTFTYTSGSTVNYTTGDNHIYFWILCTTSTVLGTTLGTGTGKENGLRLRVGQDTSNYKEFNLGGKTQYPGGWVCFAVDPNSTADATLGAPDGAHAGVEWLH